MIDLFQAKQGKKIMEKLNRTLKVSSLEPQKLWSEPV